VDRLGGGGGIVNPERVGVRILSLGVNAAIYIYINRINFYYKNFSSENNSMAVRSSYPFVQDQKGPSYNTDLKMGGPPLSDIGIFQAGPTGCDPNLFAQVQNAINCQCNILGPTGGIDTLCHAAYAGQIATTEPFACMIDVIANKSCCGQKYPQDVEDAAAQAFADVTGYKPIDLDTAFDTLQQQSQLILEFNSFFFFMPVLILILIVIWLMVGFRWINWVVGLFATTLSIVVMYGFAIAYRVSALRYLNEQGITIKNNLQNAQNNFDQSVAYWPQGLFAATCAISKGSEGWTCNDCNPCPPCTSMSQRQAVSRKMGAQSCATGVCPPVPERRIEVQEEEEEEEEELIVRPRRNFRSRA
jgi:hypothetical protein